MLQQILQDMYIDPDILAELDDEQKEILFCKMREEQVRKWKEYEDKLEATSKNEKPKKPKPGKKHVDFLNGKDGNLWVWVMGEHEDDKTIDDILEAEAQKNARKTAEKEAEELQRQAEEEAINLVMKETKELPEKKKPEQTQPELLRNRKLSDKEKTIAEVKRSSLLHIMEVKEQRENEIYTVMKEMHKKMANMAEEAHPFMEAVWKEQEEKSKKAEAEKKLMARQARAEHRRSRSLHTESQIISSLMTTYHAVQKTSDKPAIAKKPVAKARSSKPKDRSAVIKWFQEVEEPRGSGLDSKTNQVALWFHGIISRQCAEDLLEEKEEGAFLVRVSEKVYGYAVSLKGAVRCKHFLIDATDAGYKFFGINQMLHLSLGKLITYHYTNPISNVGKERLLKPCGQVTEPPDTLELFKEPEAEVSYL